MEVVHVRCAGMDISKKDAKVCVLYRCLGCSRATGEVITDRAPALANVIEDLTPGAWHNTGQYENNRIECDHGRLKARLRPVGGAEDSTNGERGDPRARLHPESPPRYYELAVDATPVLRLATAFDELRLAM